MKEYKDMTYSERLSWSCGTILIGIGEGKFRSAVSDVMNVIMQASYDHGYKQGLEAGQKNQEPNESNANR